MLKKGCFFIMTFAVLTYNGFAENSSLSVDPLTFLGMLASYLDGNSEQQSVDIQNVWASVELNFETKNQKELGFGLFARAGRVALRIQYRSFYNKERQSGFFWGLYGQTEWRRMYWTYDENDELTTGWNFPFIGNDNVYHSIGLTGGCDIGFRIRGDKVGITPYIGFGLPLFFCFGDLPPKKDYTAFYVQNAIFRAVDIGLRIDFFL